MIKELKSVRDAWKKMPMNMVQRALIGVYHRLRRKHLQRYLDEISAGRNHSITAKVRLSPFRSLRHRLPHSSVASGRQEGDVIRQASASDEPEIRACAEQAYARYVPLIGRKPAPMVADFAAQIAAGEVYVSMDDRNGFQGFIVFHAEEGHVLLENVAVLPRAAGRGVGKTLINFCEKAAQELGHDAVHLYTNEKMSENLSIYPKLGYVEVGRRAEDGFNRVYFEKALA